MPLLLFAAIAALFLPCGKYAQAGVERERLFNDSWRFHRGAAEGAEQPAFDDSAWRELDLPHDYSIEDLPRHEDLPRIKALKGTWRFKKGDAPGWMAPDLDDSSWQRVELPAAWEKHSGYVDDNVFGWFRREITVAEELRGQDILLDIGKADDVDRTYFNGRLVGGMGSYPPDYDTPWPASRRYRVPSELIRYGKTNHIAVRLFDGYGPGGLRKQSSDGKPSGPFDPEVVGGLSTGFTRGGTGWYRKAFQMQPGTKGKRVRVRFDGVYMDTDVWINGRHLGNHPYGYTSFSFDLTEHVNFTGRNVLAVEVKNLGRNTRWYSGSGIYRHVWLTATDPVHVAPWGVFVTTPQVDEEEASVQVRTQVFNKSARRVRVEVRTSILDPGGRRAATASSARALRRGQDRAFVTRCVVTNPALWSPDHPALHTAVTEIVVDGQVRDRVETRFGIRSISFDAERGFLLNGKTVLLKGGCMHHDNGPLGTATFDDAERRRVRTMKESGFNAIRTSHNPPSPGFLEACDELGVLVIDEIFDHWRRGKNSRDYSRWFEDWWERDIGSFILRDRNHPSVIMYSIGNEIPERLSPRGLKTARGLATRIRELDPTRPVTEALNGHDNWKKMDEYFDNLDVAGYNYRNRDYQPDHERVPERIMYASESFPMFAFDYWMAVLDHPWVIGDFVWTGHDYLGEASIGWYSFQGGGYPWTVAYCGDIDICGFKRAQSYYRDVLWKTGNRISVFVHSPDPTFGERKSMLWGWDDVHASWNWPGREGKNMKVDVYSGCEKVKLLLNGREIGEKATSRETKFTASWEVPYRPGSLKAIGYDGGEKAAEWEIKTAGRPSAIRLRAERDTIRAGGQDLAYIVVEVVDADGVRHPRAENLIKFEIDGPGTIAGAGNGNPMSVESFQKPFRKAFEGRALVIIRSGKEPGTVTLDTRSEGLAPASVTVEVR